MTFQFHALNLIIPCSLAASTRYDFKDRKNKRKKKTRRNGVINFWVFLLKKNWVNLKYIQEHCRKTKPTNIVLNKLSIIGGFIFKKNLKQYKIEKDLRMNS